VLDVFRILPLVKRKFRMSANCTVFFGKNAAAVSSACLHVTKQELLDMSIGILCRVQWSDLQNE